MKILSIYYEIKYEISSYRHTIYEFG